MARTLFLALAGLVVLAAVCDARECDSASNTQLSKDACADSTFLLDKYTTDITIGFDAHNLGEAPEDAGDELDAAGPLCYELDCIFSALVDGELKTKSAQWLSCDKETRDAFLECKADNDNVCGACKDEYLAAVNLPTDGYNFKRGVHEEGVFGRGYYWDPVTKMLVHDSHVASKSRDVDGNLALEFDLRDTVECTDDCPQTLIKPSIQSLLAGNVHEFDIDWKSHVRFSSAASRSDVRISYTINPCRTTITTCLFGIMVDEKVSWDSVFVQNIPPCASIDGITVEGIHLLGPGDHSAYLAYDCNNADVHINGNPGVAFSVLNPYHVGPNAESATLFANPQDF